MYYFSSCILAIILIASSGCSNNKKLTQTDLSEITALDQQFARGWFAKNPQDSVLNAFENEAVFIPHHGGQAVVGTEKLREFFWPKDLEGIVHSFNHYPDDIDGNAEIAWVRGRFDLKYSWIIKGDTTTTINEGNYVMVCRKNIADQWKIATFIFNDPPAEISL